MKTHLFFCKQKRHHIAFLIPRVNQFLFKCFSIWLDIFLCQFKSRSLFMKANFFLSSYSQDVFPKNNFCQKALNWNPILGTFIA